MRNNQRQVQEADRVAGLFLGESDRRNLSREQVAWLASVANRAGLSCRSCHAGAPIAANSGWDLYSYPNGAGWITSAAYRANREAEYQAKLDANSKEIAEVVVKRASPELMALVEAYSKGEISPIEFLAKSYQEVK
jgi:hypothetical protein